MNYKLIIQFDGSRYFGWQKQSKVDMTIQEKIEKVLSKRFNQGIQVIGCSRTDSGVHAINYTANFNVNDVLDVLELKSFMNQYLPEDIIVKEVRLASERFHSRYNSISKTYLYRICNSTHNDVFYRKYSWHVQEQLDLDLMTEASKILIGTHDFKAFTNKSKNKNTMRTINYINIIKQDNMINITINGNSFLLNMVRILVGTLKEVGEGKREVSSIYDLLEYGNRELSGERALAKGLHLVETIY